MISITKKQLKHFDLDYPTPRQRDWINYLPELLQERFDELVVSHTRLVPLRVFSKLSGGLDRRCWIHSARGIITNLTAAKVLERKEIDWKAVLVPGEEAPEMRLAA